MLWLFQVLLITGLSLQRLQCFTVPFRNAKLLHKESSFSQAQINKLANLTDVQHMNEVLDNICIPRVVGTLNHKKVTQYIKSSLRSLGWNIESDQFMDITPLGERAFENIIATLNPGAKRYLTLACHHDSKYEKNYEFEGATDSAVPCMQLINLAYVMDKYLKTTKHNELSLMLLFLDGEEAFQSWSPTDSLYGARHLASKWHKNMFTHNNEKDLSYLDKIDLFVLLDLIGAQNPTFYNYFRNTSRWYSFLLKIENDLANMRLFEKYRKPHNRYFSDNFFDAGIEDDHLPFLEKNVTILHLIPHPFPNFWHKPGDNRKAVSLPTVENINKILRVFVAAYLNVQVEEENVQLTEHLEL